MFGKKDKAATTNMIDNLLLEGEIVEYTYPLLLDFFYITNKRLLFINEDINTTKMYSIAFDKIEEVTVERNIKISSLTNVIEIVTKSNTHQLKFMKGEDIEKIFKHIVSKTV